ncbi:hypothetical protein HPP92_019876 [Vanilla planifolia]|uniref:Uncharacterized protein n=1 Tax=Vanilla planifolia TaxID=51239 RepID=A0A835UJC0_VANPL|nr:hypothetical protein HPP92_019876 [Vanilla planifolia]
MPATAFSAFHLIFFPLLLSITAFAYLLRKNRKVVDGSLPPGSLGLPFVGETLRLINAYRTENPEPFVDERLRRNGTRLFTTHLFGELTVFSADPEFNRVVLGGEGRTFEGSYPSSISTLLGRNSLVLMKGALHKRMHSLTLTRFASPAVIRSSLLPDIDLAVRRNLRSWAAAGDLHGASLLLLNQAKKITFEMAVEQLISEGPGRRWAEALTKLVRRRKEEKDNKAQVAESRKKDMVDELLEADEGFTEEEMVDFLLALLVAGHETTPTIMTIVVKFLTENPSALALVKEEQEEIRARKKDECEALEWSDYKSMSFTQCVINETLRVSNIISGVFRRAVADVHFQRSFV